MDHNDATFYEKAASELADKTADRGLFAKAFSLSMGDTAKTKALYIQFRVEQLTSQATERAAAEAKVARERDLRSIAEERAKREAQKISPAIPPPTQSSMRFP